MARKSKKQVEVAAPTVTEATLIANAREYPQHHVTAAELEVDFDDRTIANADSLAKDTDLAINIALYGQQQPVVAYRDALDEKFRIVAGRTRTRAIARLNDGFDASNPKTGVVERFHAPGLKVWVAECPQSSKEDLFLAALSTNIKQNALTVVQEAYAIKHLTERLSYSLTEAAALFGYNNTNRASRLIRLLDNQPADVIARVHEGKLSLDAAISLEGVADREKRVALIAECSDDTGRVDGGKLRSKLRDFYVAAAKPEREEFDTAFGFKYDEKPNAEQTFPLTSGSDDSDSDGEDAEPTVNIKRSAADLRKAIASFVGNEEEPATDTQKAFFKVLVGYLDGPKSETQLLNAVKKYIA